MSVTHKFRACLGKSRVMRSGDRVLVGFSGSDGSTALLHLIQSGLGDTSHKRLMVQPLVLYIDGKTFVTFELEIDLLDKQSHYYYLTKVNKR